MHKKITTDKKSKPAISTASLPDIIFMLLFFFMVTTVLRKQELLKIVLPSATELTTLEHRSLVNHIYVGKARNPTFGTAPKIQINDAFVRVKDLEPAMQRVVATKDEKLHPLLTTSLKVDQHVKMGIINDVKKELRKARLLKLSYAAVPEL